MQTQVQDKTGSIKFITTLALINVPKYFAQNLFLSLSLSLCDQKQKKTKNTSKKKTITEMKVLALHFNLPGDSTVRSADRH